MLPKTEYFCYHKLLFWRTKKEKLPLRDATHSALNQDAEYKKERATKPKVKRKTSAKKKTGKNPKKVPRLLACVKPELENQTFRSLVFVPFFRSFFCFNKEKKKQTKARFYQKRTRREKKTEQKSEKEKEKESTANYKLEKRLTNNS